MKMMKVLLSVAIVVGLSVGSASASHGRVSDKSLAKMGLQGMKTMSDEQGMKIRGAGQDSISDIFKDISRLLDKIEDLLGGHHHR